MRTALLVYHKNLTQYPPHWIEKFRDSILNQTHKDFAILELNYGGTNERIFDHSYFESFSLPNFAHALNYLLAKCLNSGYDVVFNSNIDDYFSYDRFEKQISVMREGYDIVSSNFNLITNDEVTHRHKLHDRDIVYELSKNHNVLCHPVIAYSKKFIQHNVYDPQQTPFEDMMLWMRGLLGGFKFKILEDVLCYHRVHPTSAGHKPEEV